MARGIFVSYRRDDTAHVAGRIHDALTTRFGRDRIFMDVDSVAPGEDFVRKIEDTVAASGAMIVVMGPNWLNAQTKDGKRRIDLPGDFVRLEVSNALKRGLRIIPVLVDGAPMPRAEDLPEDVAQLVRHNAVSINHTTFRRDIAGLLAHVDPPGLVDRLKSPRVMAPLAAALAVLALAVTFWPKPNSVAAAERLAVSSTVSLDVEEDDGYPPPRTMLATSFKAERSADGTLSIRSDLPYRERLRSERKVSGVPFDSAVFPISLVSIRVDVDNARDTALPVSELQFEVISADPDMAALPVVRENQFDYRVIVVANEGWGPLEDPVLTVTSWGAPEADYETSFRAWRDGVELWDPCADPTRIVQGAGTPVTATAIEGNADHVRFDLESQFPGGFGDLEFVCAMGTLAYVSEGEPIELAFRSRVSNYVPPYAVAGVGVGFYDLYLDPDREGYVAVVPAFEDVPAGETGIFTVRVNTSRTSAFRLHQRVRTASGQTIEGEELSLEIFVPRTVLAWFELNPEKYMPVPDWALEGVPGREHIATASYDPQGRSAAMIVLAEEIPEDTCNAMAETFAERLKSLTGGEDTDLRIDTEEGDSACEWWAER
ncbi:MAG: toll/interleukin-1 receptor domain-containing protein [Hyphomonas sp.]|uniref:toll/interleukin-1 receptor domain-containing protein n=1 Tax=Hyphomonas sp. TaxID=87 RepID=UPI003527C0A9